jgi:hypothetical protein
MRTGGTGNSNTLLGFATGKSITSGFQNELFGYQTGQSLTSGSQNALFGYQTGQSLTSGTQNSFFGNGAGQNNTTGTGNAFFGYSSGANNSNGVGNAFFGTQAGQLNTTGSSNSFIGGSAGFNNTTGSSNSFFGNGAGNGNTTGSNNTFIGFSSSQFNTTGGNNSFVGNYSGYNNTTASNNTFIGNQAAFNNTTGSTSVAIGSYSLFTNSTGASSTAIGYQALYYSTSSGNTALGYQAGIGDGSILNQRSQADTFATFLGFQTSRDQIISSSTLLTNITAIGKNARVGVSNAIVLGGTSTDAVTVGIGTTTPNYTLTMRGVGGTDLLEIASSTGTSLLRMPQNGRIGIGSSTPSSMLSMNVAAGVNPFQIASSSGAAMFTVAATGNLTVVGSATTCNIGNGVGATSCTSDSRLKENVMNLDDSTIDKVVGLRGVTFNWNAIAGHDQTPTHTGFIAQEVQTLFPDSVNTVYHDDAMGDVYGVDYASLVVPAIKAIQTLNTRLNQASSTLSTLGVTVASNYANASSSIAALSATVANNYNEASSSIAALNGSVATNTSNITSLQSGFSTLSNVLNITSATTTTITLGANGVVGIGNNATQLGDEKLRVSGRVRATGFDVDSAADLAENFEAVEAVDAGTVVAFSTTTVQWNIDQATSSDAYTMSTVRKAVASYEAVGVISTNPGIVLGKSLRNGVPVAFSGRIPVKVTTENGEIKQGDYLTVSTTMPGYAMKLTGEGHSIGRALSDYVSGRDKVLMIVENGVQKLDLAGKNATTTGMLTTGNVDLNANGVAITNIKSLASANGTWSIDENGRIVAKQLCLEDLCIDKTTLTNLLQVAGQTGMVLGASTTTVPSSSTSTQPVVGTSTDPGISGSSTDPGSIASSTPGVSASTTDQSLLPTNQTATGTQPVVVPQPDSSTSTPEQTPQ